MSFQALFQPLMAPAEDGADLPGAPSVADLGGDGSEPPADAAPAAAEPSATGQPAGDDGDDHDDRGGEPAKNARIPVARHKAILERERAARVAAEQALKQAQALNQSRVSSEQLQAYQQEVDKKETAYQQALLDGDTAKAEALRREIRTLERSITNEEIRTATAQAETRARESARYEIALERIEAAYPALNQDDEAYDAELAEDVMDKMGALMQRGFSPYEALQTAVRRVMGAPGNKAQERAVTVAPSLSGKGAKDASRAADEGRATATAGALQVMQRTPPALGRAGSSGVSDAPGSDAASLAKLSYEEFNKLPPEVLARARGDIL